MTKLLIALSALEAVIALAVLLFFVNLVTQRLRSTVRYLGKIGMGVRAVEHQTATLGPSVTTVNQNLRELNEAVTRLTSTDG